MKVFVFLALAAVAAAAPKLSNFNGSGRIVGGEDVADGEFPYYAQIQVASSIGLGDLCGAAIYDHFRIITSGACAYVAKQYGAFFLNIRVGRGSSNEESRLAVLIQYHANFTEEVFDSDIGIITLATPLIYNEHVQPIPLANESYVASGDLTTIGFGSAKPGDSNSRPGKMQKATLTVIDNEECTQNYADDSTAPVLTDHMICASAPDQSICNGDIGSPLIAKDEDGNDFLAGLSSWGHGSCLAHPSVFTSVASLRGWLQANLHPLQP